MGIKEFYHWLYSGNSYKDVPLDELVSEAELKRLERVWTEKGKWGKFMPIAEFVSLFLQHPRIPIDVYKLHFGSDPTKLTFKDFVVAVTILSKAETEIRRDFICGNEIDWSNIKLLSMHEHPGITATDNNILAGVTHFEQEEIAELVDVFDKIHGPQLMKITEKKFYTLLKDILPDNIISGLFRAFDENGDRLIDFKEFVFGLSALCCGPDNARIKFMAQIWDSDLDGFLDKDDIVAICQYLHVNEEAASDLLSHEKPSLLDFVCWSVSNPAISRHLISLGKQVGYLGLGLVPHTIKQKLEIICDVKTRFEVCDLKEWAVVPVDWWSQLIVALNPCCPETILPLDNSGIIAPVSKDPNTPSTLAQYPILRENLMIRKDYELVPTFLFNALSGWERIQGESAIIRKTLEKSAFLPNKEWPDCFGSEENFPGSHFVELYPPSLQIIRHAFPPAENGQNKTENNRYYIWRYMCPSRATSIGELLLNFSRIVATDLDNLRIWLVEKDRKPSRMLVSNGSLNLHRLGILSHAQFLLEIRNRDMSWPEEIDVLLEDSNNFGIKMHWNKSTESLYSGTGGVVNMGNTCYMSAALQSLSNIGEMTAFFLNESEGYIPPDSLAKEYCSFIQSLIVENKSVAPKRLKNALSKQTTAFADRLQHDCQEFLQIFLDLLHQDINKAKLEVEKCGLNESAESVSKADRVWGQYRQKEDSIIVDLFSGLVQSTVKCTRCGHDSPTYDVFSCIQLPLPLENNFIILPIFVIKATGTVITRYGLRIPPSTEFSDVKDLLSEEANISGSSLEWILINKATEKIEVPATRQLEETENIPIIDILAKHLDIYAYEICRTHTSNPFESTSLIALHRKSTHNNVYAIRATDGTTVSVFGVPFFVNFIQGETTPKELYEEVMENIRRFSSDSGSSSLKTLRTNRAIDANEDARSGYPFSLCFTTEDGLWCDKCDWAKLCHGCVLDSSSNDIIDQDPKRSILAVEWKPEALYLRYSLENLREDDESYVYCMMIQNSTLTLDHCLTEFTRPELITDSTCDNCKEMVDREKSIRFLKLPKIMIIHLKRFIFLPQFGQFVKSKKLVDISLENFDMSPYFLLNDSNNMPQMYNCISIVNHHGELNCGHYTSYVKKSDQWFFFNDSFCKPVKRENLETKDAYLLFYERIDE
ncbi:ubiquitin carboxyl-terminal hydrolase domain-containing protein [Ditylenchus destructor]|uniref:ubiquitinyl hydrolase 1 n=1 Tax=Ditylenchus destructor TaxID=166010 RepID=A0AAD4NIP5_9BILA|nr:ubiquitin carboxyl-terminal hydrolase domain-containing protein [Ditylenchus destructor]